MKRLLRTLGVLIRQIAAAWRTTADTRSFVRLAADFALFRLLPFLRLPGANRERTIGLHDGVILTYRLNRGDIWAIYEVWMLGGYAPPFQTHIETFVDLGANIGLTSLWCARKHGARRLVVVEPSAANADLARRNLRQNHTHAQVIEAAAGAADATATFEEFNWSTYSRLVFDQRRPPLPGGSGLQLVRQYPVRVLSMASLLAALPAETRLGLVKIDVEGGEQELLTGDTDWLEAVDALVVEFHPPHAQVPRLVEVLEKAGFHRHSHRAADAQSEVHWFVRRRPPASSPT